MMLYVTVDVNEGKHDFDDTSSVISFAEVCTHTYGNRQPLILNLCTELGVLVALCESV